jgi:hypothetical protein
MVGNILLLLSLIFFFNKNLRYISIILYIGFLTGTWGGYNIFTNDIINNFNANLAFVYTVVIVPFVLSAYKTKIKDLLLIRIIIIFNVFLTISCLYSFLHYDLSLEIIFKAAKVSYLTLSIIIFRSLSSVEINKIIRIIGIICFVVSICFLLQVLVNVQILPYPYIAEIDTSTGIMRYYNYPEMLSFYLILSFLDKRTFYGNINIYRVVFLLTVFSTLGRSYIVANLIGVFLVFFADTGAQKRFQYLLLLTALITAFSSVIEDRFFKTQATSNDLGMIINSEYKNTESFGNATLAYRMGWIYERLAYLSKRPISEPLFGLGFVNDAEPISRKMYKFDLGLLNRDTGIRTQLETPDIAWGNLLTRYGLIGIILCIIIFITLIKHFYKFRKIDPLFHAGLLYIIVELIGSISSSNLGYPKNYAFFFLVYILMIKKIQYVKAKDINHYSNVQL